MTFWRRTKQLRVCDQGAWAGSGLAGTGLLDRGQPGCVNVVNAGVLALADGGRDRHGRLTERGEIR